mmetsp:Transcript_23892/g.36575  ORF Transcript_23892/g.36575 Transcript_23892/m.36575 type:complete len:116 (+) Transcript_23892:42-389(+)
MRMTQEAKRRLSSHFLGRVKIDCLGIFFNFLFIPIGFYYFIFRLAQRLDGNEGKSYFFVLIPIWIMIVPFAAYFVLNGLAAQTTRIRPWEKFALSVIVPCKYFHLTLSQWASSPP